MAVFSGLPPETIVEIFSYLSCPDLASTARVSHYFNLISQPLLYTTLVLRKIPEPGAGRSSPALGILLRTLLTPGCKTLASYVRSLYLEWDTGEVEFPSMSSTASIDLMTTMASRLNIRAPLKSHTTQLMLLLDLFPRLQSLHLSPPNNFLFTRHLQSSLATGTLPLGLQSLRQIICTPSHDSSDVSSKTLLQYMQLPHVRYLEVPSVNWYTRSLSTLTSAVASSRVTHLRFSYAEIPSWSLAYILCVPIALTHFSYSAVSGGNFNLPRFMAALEPLKKSLKVLHLDFGDVDLTTSDDEEEFLLPYEEGSLREWSALTTLSCSLMPLLGKGQLDGSPRLVDVLPVGLRELEILQDSHWWVSEEVDQVVEMLQSKESVVPQLEKVAVVMEWGTVTVPERLVVACEAAGVKFVDEPFCW